MSESTALMNTIRKYDFALNELKLYLDTHPHCANALSYFKKYRELRDKARDEYIRKYGPITADQTNTNEGWCWIKEPWPWEKEAN